MRKTLLLLALATVVMMAQDSVDVTPKIFGYIRSWEQVDLAINQGAFLTKEARFGVRGNVNAYASYKLHLDFTRLGKLTTTTTKVDTGKASNLGTVSVINSATASFSDVLLDAEATFKPDNSLALTLGQFVVPVSTDNLKGGADLDFVNRPLMAATVTPELRDAGFLATYTTNISVPLEIKAGVYNGSGQNKPENDRSMNYSARVVVQPMPTLAVAANYYGGRFSTAKMNMFDFGAEYKYGKFFFSGEFAQRKSDYPTNASATMSSYYIYGLYDFDFGKSMVSHIIPAVRYERYDPNTSIEKNEISRIVPGVSFEFSKVKFAQIRINYELFDYKDGSTNPNKLIFQFVCRF